MLAGLAVGLARAAPAGFEKVSRSAGLPVIPFPGTPDAAPSTQIIFSALGPSQLRSVTVTGSRSGRHSGALSRLPDGAGTAFVPRRAFSPGEQVSVSARLASLSAARASGVFRSYRLAFSFGVARSGQATAPGGGHAPPRATSPGTTARRLPPTTRSFHSAPGIHPTTVSVTADPDPRSGDIFLTPKHAYQNGEMILDSRGRLLWFSPVAPGVNATNLEVQSYRGHHVLTWWQGGSQPRDVIMSPSYRRIATLHGGNGYSADRHEFQLTRQGTALINALVPVKVNLSRFGGPRDGTVDDCVIQELDIGTGRVLWEWHARGHVPLRESHKRPHGSSPWDYFHLNSIQQLADGNLLISARNTWAIYEISRRTGKVLWTLGGKDSSFKVPHAARFEWQHDAHLVDSRLTLFDDAAHPQEEPQSSAKVLELHYQTRTVSLAHRYTHSPPLLAQVAGSVQTLPDKNLFVGWGKASDFSEYTPAGRQVFNGQFPLGTYSYRAYRFPWTGHPSTRPSLSISPRRHRSVRVYVSWNGDTQVAFWRVLAGPSRSSLTPRTTRRWMGFETGMTLHRAPRYLVVQALDAAGHVLRATRLQRV
jgi:hypothetical protein